MRVFLIASSSAISTGELDLCRDAGRNAVTCRHSAVSCHGRDAAVGAIELFSFSIAARTQGGGLITVRCLRDVMTVGE
jgi:hypothetical protein